MAEPVTKAKEARVQKLTGKVSSTKGTQTIRVVVESLAKHPQYGKYLRHKTKVAVHDPSNVAKLGDVVEIVPCRRISATKSWRLVRVIRSDEQAAPAAK